jgi:hypothetical protein
MGLSSDKDINVLIRKAKKAGWKMEFSSSGHGKLVPPNGGRVLTFPLTPSGHTPAAKALRSKLRKRGVDV